MPTQDRFLHNRVLTICIIVMLWIGAALKILLLLFTVGVFIAAVIPSEQEANPFAESPVTQTTSQVKATLTDHILQWWYPVILVLLLIWIYRAYRNLKTVQVPTKYAPGWAPASFFIPVFNLWMPYQIMQDIFNYTQRIALAPQQTEYLPKRSTLVSIWWITSVLFFGALFIIYGLPWIFNFEYKLGFENILIIPVIVENLYLLAIVIQCSLATFLVQHLRRERAATRRIKALRSQQTP